MAANRVVPSGYESASHESWPMADETCLPLNRLWCEVLEDANPAYYDAKLAQSLFGGIIAPPTMTMTWCSRPEWTPDGRRRSIHEGFKNSLPDFPHSVSLRNIHRYARPLKMGERLTVHKFTNPPTEVKATHRGSGRQIDQYTCLRDESGADIVVWVNEALRFATPKEPVDQDANLPKRSPELAANAGGPRPARIEDIREGQLLPAIELPLTIKRFIKWVAATRDYFEAHHDRDYARATGARDMYIGVHFFHGFAGRLVTDWAGPRALLRRLELVSWGRAFPGETARMAGKVAKVDRDKALVDLTIEGSCERGKLYDVSATVELLKHEE